MKELNNEYKIWLQTLGFAESSVKSLPNYTAEMLTWLDRNHITGANQTCAERSRSITAEAIKAFFFHWKNRKNKRTGAGLSQSHINQGALAINNFIRFLKLTGKNNISLKLEREERPLRIPQILTLPEIQSLYEATHNNIRRVNTTAYAQRDRAMLAVYYGCGLRRSEGNNLVLSDILTEKKLLYVRKGKGSKERFVPIAEKGMQDMEEYLQYGRKWFLQQRQKKKSPPLGELEGAFFINIWGEPMKDFAARIGQLKEEAGIQKQITLHSFRHSIATHLLQGGMDIEQIKKFLGHATLESTQIYTHILNELSY